MTGTTDYTVIVWNHEKQKCIAFSEFSQPTPGFILRHISFAPFDQNVMLLTGKDVFSFYKLSEQGTIKCLISQFKGDAETSKDFTCHAWMSDGKFILCTREGQILQCDSNGDYKKVIIFDPKKPTKTPINSVQSFTIGSADPNGGGKLVKAGFLVGYESGHIRVYMKSDTIGIPYKRAESDRDDLMMLNDYERSTEMH